MAGTDTTLIWQSGRLPVRLRTSETHRPRDAASHCLVSGWSMPRASGRYTRSTRVPRLRFQGVRAQLTAAAPVGAPVLGPARRASAEALLELLLGPRLWRLCLLCLPVVSLPAPAASAAGLQAEPGGIWAGRTGETALLEEEREGPDARRPRW